MPFKISDLPEVITTPAATTYLEVAHGGTSSKISLDNAATAVGAALGVSAYMLTVVDDASLAVFQSEFKGAGTSTPVEGLTDSNTAIGLNALVANTDGSENTAFGVHALKVNTTGTENNAFGALALAANQTSSENVAVGVRALTTLNGGNGANTAVGHAAMNYSTTAQECTAVGQTALYNNTEGIQNTAVGRQALQTNTTGGKNTAVGAQALNLSTGDNNSAVGRQALAANGSGSQNSAIGVDSGLNLTTGSANTILGYSTGLGITTGSNNTILGANISGLSATTTGHVIIADGNGNIRARHDATDWSMGDSLVLESATAIPAGGATGAGLRMSSTANNGLFFGSGVPTLSAAQGSLYIRSDGSTSSNRAYVNTNGSTTWTALITLA